MCRRSITSRLSTRGWSSVLHPPSLRPEVLEETGQSFGKFPCRFDKQTPVKGHWWSCRRRRGDLQIAQPISSYTWLTRRRFSWDPSRWLFCQAVVGRVRAGGFEYVLPAGLARRSVNQECICGFPFSSGKFSRAYKPRFLRGKVSQAACPSPREWSRIRLGGG